MSYVILLMLLAQIYNVSNLPNNLMRSTKDLLRSPTIIEHATEANSITSSNTRKKKGPNIPLSNIQYLQHHLLVPNLHVIPITNVRHDNINITHSNFIPILIPIHNLVPVHDLTVIPLHRVNEPKISYRVSDEEDNRYRNPLGGYGVGWSFGGHGAGHGFHYSYG